MTNHCQNRPNYRRIFEICMIISLVIHLIIFQVIRTNNKRSITQYKINQIKIEVVQIPKTWQRKKIRRPKRPDLPTVPIPVEEEYIPEDLTIVPTKLDFENIPPPPGPPLDEYDYENYSFIPFQSPPKVIGILTSSGIKRGGMAVVKKEIKYPRILKLVGVEGRTILGLLINKKGFVTKITIIKESEYQAFDDEAIRIASLIKFSPAIQRDRPVKVWLAMPFTFKLR